MAIVNHFDLMADTRVTSCLTGHPKAAKVVIRYCELQGCEDQVVCVIYDSDDIALNIIFPGREGRAEWGPSPLRRLISTKTPGVEPVFSPSYVRTPAHRPWEEESQLETGPTWAEEADHDLECPQWGEVADAN